MPYPRPQSGKVPRTGKLRLLKDSLRVLNSQELRDVRGGDLGTAPEFNQPRPLVSSLNACDLL